MSVAYAIPPIATIVIRGEPCAQGRGRAGVVRGKGGRPILSKRGDPIVRVYDPKKSRTWKATAQDVMTAVWGTRPPLTGPVGLTIVAVFTCPRSAWKKRKPVPRQWHTKRGDFDNIAKAVCDAAKGVLWVDDSQVALANVHKLIGAQGEAPYVELIVQSLEEVHQYGVQEAQRTEEGEEGGEEAEGAAPARG